MALSGLNQYVKDARKSTMSCFCIGPQNGQPLCPCRMRNVKIVDGRYVQEIDLGPAPATAKDQEA